MFLYYEILNRFIIKCFEIISYDLILTLYILPQSYIDYKCKLCLLTQSYTYNF